LADTKEIRRQQLRRLVNEHDGMNNLGRKLGFKKGAYISQLLTSPPSRELSEKTARKWERALRLPVGWFDAPPAVQPINVNLLAQALADVLEAFEAAPMSPSPKQIAELVSRQYSVALRRGKADRVRIRKLLGKV
jgi:hypothetical protein